MNVRLNTNESPFPPPAAWRDAFAAELSRAEWQRYPDRGATALREGIARPEEIPAECGVMIAGDRGLEVARPALASPVSRRRAGRAASR